MNQYLEIFTLITGVLYVILEILQKNAMWVVGILTAAAAVIVFWTSGLYASMGLNIYYVVVSVIGLITWVKDSQTTSGGIHLRPLIARTALWSALIFVFGTLAFSALLRLIGDPASLLDSGVTVLSAIATLWLARSITQQWLLWILADIGSVILCITQQLPWMAALYALYVLSAVYGYYHWKTKGQYI